MAEIRHVLSVAAPAAAVYTALTGRLLNRMKRLCESGVFAPEAEATASDAV